MRLYLHININSFYVKIHSLQINYFIKYNQIYDQLKQEYTHTMSLIRQKLQYLTEDQLKSRYQYKEMIDAGSYGVVFWYHDIENDNQVAIKFLRDEDKLDTFWNQYQIMRNIDHPNVLRCQNFLYIPQTNKYLLIMPYCSRNNLKKCLPEIQTFDQKFKLWLCVQMARGIKALHDENIMHRDIKPANILIDQDWTIKLCDFGFGRFDEDQQKTQKVGTPLYIDPNVNSGYYSKKCDIYSLGLVMDTVFRGKSCYNNVPRQKFPQELLYFKQNKQNIIRKLQCSEEIKKIILDCLKNSQSDRLDANQLLERLEAEYSKLDQGFKLGKNLSNLTNSEEIGQKKFKKNNKVENNQQFKEQQKIYPDKKICKPFIEASSQSKSSEQKWGKQKSQRQKKEGRQQLLKSLSYKNTNNIKIHLKLLNLRNNLGQCEQKNSNFQTIYTHFVGRVNKIRQIQDIKDVISIPKRDKKVVIFIALFGYLRFLKVHKAFLKNKTDQIKYVQSIKGIPFQKISQKTIQLSLSLIQSQIQCTKRIIKPYLVELNADRSLYKPQVLSNEVAKMITEGMERKFGGIEKIPEETVRNEYEVLVLSQRYRINDKNQLSRIQKLKQISEVF